MPHILQPHRDIDREKGRESQRERERERGRERAGSFAVGIETLYYKTIYFYLSFGRSNLISRVRVAIDTSESQFYRSF